MNLLFVQLRASLNTTRLQKDNMRRQFLYAQSNLNCTVRELSQCQKTIQAWCFYDDSIYFSTCPYYKLDGGLTFNITCIIVDASYPMPK